MLLWITLSPSHTQGEDIQCLEAEMTLASEQLHRAQELRRECKKAEWRGVGGKETGGRGTGGKSHESGGKQLNSLCRLVQSLQFKHNSLCWNLYCNVCTMF